MQFHALPPIDAVDAELLHRARVSADGAHVNDIAHADASTHLDLATARIYCALANDPANKAFAESITNANVDHFPRDVLFGIVPGAFYKHHANTGADGARIIEVLKQLGAPVELIPIRSFGRVQDNAAIINDWLVSRRQKRVVLITLSKGGADCKAALQLARSAGDWSRVSAWISLSGLTEGTALIGWLRRQPLRMIGIHLLLALRGQSFRAADDLDRSARNPLLGWPDIPAGLRLVHVVGFPTRRHLRHPWSFRGYERLSSLGPNDGGGILLRDTFRLPGIVYPVWGADHYLNPAWDFSGLLRGIVIASVDGAVRERQVTSNANAPTNAPATRSTA